MKNHKINLDQEREIKLIDKNSSLNIFERLSFTLIFAFVAMAIIVGAHTILSSII